MKALSYSVYDDIGGLGWGLASAFRKLTDWEYRQVCGQPSYLDFPQADHWDWPQIVKWWKAADVVHLHDGYHQLPSKRHGIVCTYHGIGFRGNPGWFLRQQEQHRATGLVSTLDLWLLAPSETTWCPAPYDLDWLHSFRHPLRRPDGPLRIGHAPTDRSIKHTAEFLAACEQFGRETPVEVVLIEGMSWRDCLEVKGSCDIFYDQCAFTYGGNSIEAMAMGIPVLNGAPDATLAEYERRFGDLPFVLVDPGSILEGLRMLASPYARDAWGRRGRRHVEQFHSQRAVVDLLTPIYRDAA